MPKPAYDKSRAKKIISLTFAIEFLARSVDPSDPDVQIFLDQARFCKIRNKIVLPPECYDCWEQNFRSNIEDDLKFKRHREQNLFPVPEELKHEALQHVLDFLRKDKLREFLAFLEEEDGERSDTGND